MPRPLPPPARRNRRMPPPPPAHSNSGKGACSMTLPVAVALLPYALVRMAWDGWRKR